jgi:hypothetical protein
LPTPGVPVTKNMRLILLLSYPILPLSSRIMEQKYRAMR